MRSVSTHILDTTFGKPAANVPVLLEKRGDGRWEKEGSGVTDADGRIRDLVPEGEWPLHRKEPGGDVEIQVAAGDGKWADQRLFIAFEAWCPDVPPLQLAGPDKRELPHRRHDARSNRSRFITLLHAATKSFTNFCLLSSQA